MGRTIGDFGGLQLTFLGSIARCWHLLGLGVFVLVFCGEPAKDSDTAIGVLSVGVRLVWRDLTICCKPFRQSDLHQSPWKETSRA